MKTAQSLLLITVDCLRADHTGFLGYKCPTTPFVDSLAGESLTFSSAMAAGVPTYYAFPAIMASRHPLALGRDVAGIAPDEPTMATALRESGYATAAFLAGNPYLSKRFGYDAGFDTFTDFLDADVELLPAAPLSLSAFNRALHRLSRKYGPAAGIYDELYFRYCQRIAARTSPSFDELRRFPAAHVLIDHACDWLAGVAGRPFFLWLHFMDPHGPYYPPPDALALLGCPKMDPRRARYLNSYWNRGDLSAERFERHRAEITDLYDGGIRWVDAQVSRLVSELRRLGLWDNCTLGLTADHGEEFLDHGGRFHAPSNVHEELARVPLLIRVPALKSAKSIAAPFSLVDLPPTLLEILDAPAPANFRGRSRWPAIQKGKNWEDPAVTECVSSCGNHFYSASRLGPRILGVRETRHKLIVDFASSKELLFDLENDPAELRPLSLDTDKPVRRRLLERAQRHLVDSLQARDPDGRLAARLRDLRLEWAQPTAPLSN